MKFSKKMWGFGFLGITAVAIALEVFAATDNNANTIPWTSYIVNYVPYEITFLVIGGLATWLIVHFLRWYGIIYKK